MKNMGTSHTFPYFPGRSLIIRIAKDLTQNRPMQKDLENGLLGLMPHLNEKLLRMAAAPEARSWGYGGVSAVARATGIARSGTARSGGSSPDTRR